MGAVKLHLRGADQVSKAAQAMAEQLTKAGQSLKTYALLKGFRGAPVCDLADLQEGLLRVSAMVEDIPQIAELDCNQFIVHERRGDS